MQCCFKIGNVFHENISLEASCFSESFTFWRLLLNFLKEGKSSLCKP